MANKLLELLTTQKQSLDDEITKDQAALLKRKWFKSFYERSLKAKLKYQSFLAEQIIAFSESELNQAYPNLVRAIGEQHFNQAELIKQVNDYYLRETHDLIKEFNRESKKNVPGLFSFGRRTVLAKQKEIQQNMVYKAFETIADEIGNKVADYAKPTNIPATHKAVEERSDHIANLVRFTHFCSKTIDKISKRQTSAAQKTAFGKLFQNFKNVLTELNILGHQTDGQGIQVERSNEDYQQKLNQAQQETTQARQETAQLVKQHQEELAQSQTVISKEFTNLANFMQKLTQQWASKLNLVEERLDSTENKRDLFKQQIGQSNNVHRHLSKHFPVQSLSEQQQTIAKLHQENSDLKAALLEVDDLAEKMCRLADGLRIWHKNIQKETKNIVTPLCLAKLQTQADTTYKILQEITGLSTQLNSKAPSYAKSLLLEKLDALIGRLAKGQVYSQQKYLAYHKDKDPIQLQALREQYEMVSGLPKLLLELVFKLEGRDPIQASTLLNKIDENKMPLLKVACTSLIKLNNMASAIAEAEAPMNICSL